MSEENAPKTSVIGSLLETLVTKACDNGQKAQSTILQAFVGKEPSSNLKEDELASQVLELQNALGVLNDRYASNQMELQNMKEKEETERNRSVRESSTPLTNESSIPHLEEAILHSQIQYLTEQLQRANKEVERLSWELVQKGDTVQKFELEKRQNVELYEKQLQIAHMDFKNQVAALKEKLNSEEATLPTANTRPEMQPSEKNNTKDCAVNVTLIAVKSKLENQISRLENIHECEMSQLRMLKANELDSKDEEIQSALKEMQRRDQNSTAERNGLKKTIDSLRKELDKKNILRSRDTNPARETGNFGQNSSPPRYPAPKSKNTPEVQKLQKQMINMKTALEWEKHNLSEALRRQRTDLPDASCLHNLVSTLTQGIVEKEDIIKHLKASQDAMGQEMINLQNQVKLLRKKDETQ